MELFATREKEVDLTQNIEGKPIVHIKATNSTPEILLNKEEGIIVFEGRSLPENPKVFYQPVKKWIENYLENPLEETYVKFNTDYFNTASSKMFLDIIGTFKEMASKDQKLVLEWHYQEDDDDTKEAGEEFAEMLEMEFIFVPYTKN